MTSRKEAGNVCRGLMDIWPQRGTCPQAGDSFRQGWDDVPGHVSPFCALSPTGLRSPGVDAGGTRKNWRNEQRSQGLNRPDVPAKYAFESTGGDRTDGLPMFKVAGDLPLIGFEGTLPFRQAPATRRSKSTRIFRVRRREGVGLRRQFRGPMTTFSAASKPGGSTSVFDVGAKLRT